MDILQVKNKTEDSAEIMVYGGIGEFDDVTSTGFIDELSNLGNRDLTVRINSGGGSVFTAQAIFNAIRRHSGKTIALIDGMCASAATFIATACDKVVMPRNAIFMVHKPLTGKVGNADDLRRTADFLDVVENTMIPAYAEKTGKSADELKEILRAETFMTAQEALDHGFIDEIEDTIKVAASIEGDLLNLNGQKIELKNLPKALLNNVKSDKAQPKEGDKPMDLAKFKADHAEVANQYKVEIENSVNAKIEEAIKNERTRILNIQEATLEGQEELAQKAIENGTDASVFAISAIKAHKQAEAQKGANVLAGLENDATQVASVVNTPVTPEKTAEEKEQAEIENFFGTDFGDLAKKGVKANG